MYDVVVLVASVLAAALAAVTGFGIGGLLTPLLALQVDTRVAAVSVPHVVGATLRLSVLAGGVDRRVFLSEASRARPVDSSGRCCRDGRAAAG